MMLLGWAVCFAWSFGVIPLVDTGKPVLYAVAIVGMYAIAAIGSGPTAAFIPELFSTRYRYTGSALAVNVAGVIGGALPPLIAGTLRATYGSWTIGLDAGRPRVDQPGVHLPAAGNQRNGAAHHARCARRSVGVQVLVERDALTVAGYHLDGAGHRIAPEQ